MASTLALCALFELSVCESQENTAQWHIQTVGMAFSSVRKKNPFVSFIPFAAFICQTGANNTESSKIRKKTNIFPYVRYALILHFCVCVCGTSLGTFSLDRFDREKKLKKS